MKSSQKQPRLILELNSFQIRIGDIPLFEPVNLRLRQGEMVLIQGPNGAGKTSLMRTIAGFAHDYNGSMSCYANGDDLVYQAQSHNISSHLPFNVADVITMGTGIKLQKMFEFGLVDQELAKRQWNSASGGERQRALISRSILSEPRLLLLDEPFNHLDVKHTKLVLKRLEEYFRALGQPSIVIIAHGEDRQMLIDTFDPKLINLTPSESL